MQRLQMALGLGLIGMFALVSHAQQTPSADSASGLSLQPRIIGGVQTSISQVPATVALLNTSRVELDGDLFQAQFCGGTVIAARWVLTAAHCVLNFAGTVVSPSDIMVLTGSDDLTLPNNQPIPVQAIVAHPEYRSVELGNDIALLQLSHEASVEPASLDTQAVSTNTLAFIAGWGALNSNDGGRSQSFPTQLQGTYVNMTEGSVCGSLFPNYAGLTDSTRICAGVAAGGRDACQGDSGGPLYRVDGDDNRIVAITGITSWGISCGLAEFPGIYTNVVSYVDWIQDTLRIANTQNMIALSNDNTQTAITLPVADDPSGTDNEAQGVIVQSAQAGDTRSGGAAGGMLMALLGWALVIRRGLFHASRTHAFRTHAFRTHAFRTHAFRTHAFRA